MLQPYACRCNKPIMRVKNINFATQIIHDSSGFPLHVQIHQVNPSGKIWGRILVRVYTVNFYAVYDFMSGRTGKITGNHMNFHAAFR
jgi:hypothetical protein